LIAIMLGRLEMDVDECIEVYQSLSKEVFASPKNSMSQAFAAAIQGRIKPKFNGGVLQEQIEDIIEQRLGGEDPINVPLYDPSRQDSCRV
jgi:hypothetical protein